MKLKYAIILSIIPIFLFARMEKELYKEFEHCNNQVEYVNTAIMMSCADQVSEHAKEKITKFYKIIYFKIKKQSKEEALQFELSQKNWIKYRDNYCVLTGNYIGSPNYSLCPMHLNIKRAQELIDFADDAFAD